MRSICVFLGSSAGNNPIYQDAARELGRAIAEQQLTLVYGGASVGLMGVLGKSVLDNRGSVISIILESEKQYGPLGDNPIVVADVNERIQKMIDASDSFVLFPGGIGSRHELYAVWDHYRLLSADQRKPIYLLNIDGCLNGFFQDQERSVHDGLVSQEHLNLLVVKDTVEELFEVLCFVQRARIGRCL